MSEIANRSGTKYGASSRGVVLTCLAITVIDGIDLLMYGVVLPTLLNTEQWGITKTTAGLIGSLSLVGMMIGAMGAGYLTDLLGRRPVILACIAVFTLFTTLCSVAPSLEIFGLFRLLAGLGFGGALPTVIALTQEYARSDRRQLYNGIVQAGYPIGGCIIAVSGIFLLPAFGWKSVFWMGAIGGVVVLAIAFRYLPESIAFLAGKGRIDEAEALATRYGVEIAEPEAERGRGDRSHALKVIFSPKYRVSTLMFPLVCFFGLLLGYAMNTWIPQILQSVGYDLGSALTFLLAFNLGSITGVVVLSGLADRFGPRRVISAGFLTGAVTISVLTLQPAQSLVFVFISIVGFAGASQIAVTGFVGIHYPAEVRGTALGFAVGLGRLGGIAGPILTGFILSSSLGTFAVFYVFAVIGVLAAITVALIPRVKSTTISAIESDIALKDGVR